MFSNANEWRWSGAGGGGEPAAVRAHVGRARPHEQRDGVRDAAGGARTGAAGGLHPHADAGAEA